MKWLYLIVIAVMPCLSFAEGDKVTEIENGHYSPFCSSVELPSLNRSTLPNFHEVLQATSQRVRVLRGNSPYNSLHVEDLVGLGIGKIIVYKNFSSEKDRQKLESLYRDNGYEGEIIDLPMEWKKPKSGPYDQVKACKLTMRALALVKESQVPVFFHCTVGEDRTGMLAGLLRIAYDGWSVDQAFHDEMCANGYEAGNARKLQSPGVVNNIRRNLTPLFLKMSSLIRQGKLKESDCDELPDMPVNVEGYTCSPVTDEARFCSLNQ